MENGSLNNTSYIDKPAIVGRKAATKKKNEFFDDSDDE